MPIKDLSKINYCELCKKPFHPWKKRPGKFCSHKCSAKGRDRGGIVYFEFICECCGKKVKKPKYDTDSRTRFCSLQCMANVRGKNMSGEKHFNWKGGSSRTGSYTICKKLKKEIGKCEKCGSKKELHIHHKIKVSESPDLAKDQDNIIILCKKCHAKEHPEYSGMLLKKKEGTYKKCLVCNKEFYIPNCRNAKYCSKECQFKMQKTGFYKKCGYCNKEYYTIPSKGSKYCSNRCKMLMRYKQVKVTLL